MARYNYGINGPFSGKCGTVVGASWNGINYMRSLPELSSAPATIAQQAQRNKISAGSSLLKPIAALIKLGFPTKVKGKTAMNIAMSYLTKYAMSHVGKDVTLHYDKMIFSEGILLPSHLEEIVTFDDALVQVKWNNSPETVLNQCSDKAMVILYNPEKEDFVHFEHIADRGDQEVLLQLPKDFSGDTVHCWVFFTNSDGSRVSSSNYFEAFTLA